MSTEQSNTHPDLAALAPQKPVAADAPQVDAKPVSPPAMDTVKKTSSADNPAGPSRSSGVWIGVIALLLAVGALVAAGMLWQRLGFAQQELARRSQDMAAQSAETRGVAGKAEALTNELQARLAVAEVRLSEVSLQRSQLEELMLSLSRSRDDNLVQDIDSALRLAMQQTELTGNAQPLVSALQAADQRISRAAQPRLNPVQRAIARDIEQIQGASLTDVPSLVRRVDELLKVVDEWPVHNEWRGGAVALKPSSAADAAGVAAEVAPVPNTEAKVLAQTSASNAQGWQRIAQGWTAFWQKAWASAIQNGRELVRVSRIDRPEAALLAPEQVFFLRENIKLRLLNARLELLSRQMESAQVDLLSTEQTLARYFDQNAPSVESALAALAVLRTEVSKSELPRPDESLAALATAAGGR
ncbi:MAG: uroporphyrinogen-III C-methyltransferase [Hydrogenophaga sp.]